MKRLIVAVVLLATAISAHAINQIVKPYTFVDGTRAEPSEVNNNFDTVYSGTNAAIGAINTAAGSKSSLDTRLDVYLNEDGTPKDYVRTSAFSNLSTAKVYAKANNKPIYIDANVTNNSTISLSGVTVIGAAPNASITGTGTVTDMTEARPEWFGAKADGSTDDAAAVLKTIAAANTTIFTPGKTYKYTVANVSVGTVVTGSNKTLISYGATHLDAEYVFAGNNITLKGGKYMSNANDYGWLLYFTGDDINIEDVELWRNGAINTYQAYFKTCNRVNVTRMKTDGAAGFFVEGTDMTFSDCKFKHSAGDDQFAIKAIDMSSRNIVVTNCVLENATNLIGIGSEVVAPYSVSNVTATNCVLYNCGYILYIKPGNKASWVWAPATAGIVENVTVSNIAIHDQSGTKYQHAVFLLAARDGIIRGVKADGLIAVVRGETDIVNPSFVTITLDDTYSANSQIDRVMISNCSFRDYYNGAANSGPTPGYPITYGLFINKTNGQRITNVRTENLRIKGAIAGVFNYAAADKLTMINTEIDTCTSGIINNKAMHIKGLRITNTTTPITYSFGFDDDASFEAESEYTFFGTFNAGTNKTAAIFSAAQPMYVHKAYLVNSSAISADGSNYSTYSILADGNTLGNKNTAAGVSANVQTDLLSTGVFPSNLGNIAGGKAVTFVKTDTGTGRASDNMGVLIKYIPY